MTHAKDFVLVLVLALVLNTLPLSTQAQSSSDMSLSQLASLISSLQSIVNSLKSKVAALKGTSSVSIAQAQTADITTGLVGHWKFDEGTGTIATDSSGNNNTGTLTNGPMWSTGKMGGALSLDGVDDYVALGNMDVSGSGMTIAMWVRADSFPSSIDTRFISKANSTAESGHYWMLGQTSSGGDKLRFRLKTGGSTATLIASSGNLSTNTWFHAVATYDGSMMRLYKDGVDVGSIAKSGTINIDSSIPANIGRNPDGSNYMDGTTDDIRIYNRALTSSDIQTLYAYTGGPPHCSDGIDNDSDGRIDYPNDPGCTSSADPNETDPPPPDTQAPTTPTNLSASAISSSQINLSWNASTDNVGVVGYRIYRGGTQITTVTGTTYSNTGLSPSTSYSYTVAAYDAATNVSSQSSQASATTQASGGGGTLAFNKTIIDSGFAGDVKGIGDINGDGFADLVIGGLVMNWYEYPAWTKHTIATASTEFTTDMQLVDLDADGDLDIVTGDGIGSNNVVWLENPRPSGNSASTWTKRVIGTHGDWVHDIEVGDVDQDGKLDVVTRRTMTNIFFQNSPTSWTKRDITSVVSHSGEGLGMGDIDKDGDPDIAMNGFWIEIPTSPRSASFTKRTVASGYGTEATAVIGDINNDTRPDVVFINQHSRGKMAWYEGPVNPLTDPWVERVIDGSMGSHKLNLGDLNNDGRLDIVAGLELAELAIYINQSGSTPTFSKQILSSGGLHNQRIGDIGNDGDLDIFGANYLNNPPVELWENTLASVPSGLPLNLWTYKQVSGSHQQTFGLAFGDITGDGKKDILSGSYWYQNPSGDMLGNWTQRSLPSGMHAILASDVDSDVLLDVIAQRDEGSNLGIYWLEPTSTSGATWASVLVGTVPAASHALGAQGYQAAQIESGGKNEIAVSSGNGIYYFTVPASPISGNWPRIYINANPSDEGFATGDIDADGDIDIAATTGDTKRVEWYRNPGNGTANWQAFVLGTFPEALFPDRTEIADFNKDGRLDVVVTEENGGTSDAQTYWWQQPSNPTLSNWPRTLVTSQGSTNSMDTADMDQDGDADIILAEHRGSLKVSIRSNSGSGSFTETIVSSGRESHLGAQTSDLDGDGDLDIVSIAYDVPQYLHLWRNDAINIPSPADTTPPSTPANLSVIVQSSSQINLSWNASTDNVGVAGYRVERCTGSTCTTFTQVGTPTSNSYNDVGLTANTTYRYRVRASDAAGNLSTYSSIANGTTQAQGAGGAPARAIPYTDPACSQPGVFFCEDFEGEDIINLGSNNCGSTWGNPALDNGPYGGAPATYCWAGGGSYQYSTMPLSGFNQATNRVWRATKTQSFTDVVTGRNTGTGPGTITGYFKQGIATGVRDFHARFQVYFHPTHTWPSQYDFKTVFILPRDFIDPPSAPYETGVFFTHGYWCGPSYFPPSGQNFADTPQIRYNSNFGGMPYQNEYCPPLALGQAANGTNAPRFEKNRWYTIEYHVKLASDNTGLLELWVDGNRTYREQRVTCSNGCPDIGYLMVMGWMNPADVQTGYYEIDNLAISRSYIGPPSIGTPVDTTLPTASITAPSAGSTVVNTVTISSTASDNVGVTNVEFLVDGVVKGSDSSNPYSYSWDTTNGGAHACSGPHSHTLVTRAYDAAGNVGTSANVVVSMDNPSYCSPAPSTKFVINDRVAVTNGPVTVRNAAAGTSLGTQANSTQGTVTGGPIYANLSGTNYWWWNVNFDSGADGWVAEDFISKVTTTPPPTSGGAPLRSGQPYAEAVKCAAPGVILCEDFDYPQNFACGPFGYYAGQYRWDNPGLKVSPNAAVYCGGKQLLSASTVPTMPLGSPSGGYVKRVDPYVGDGSDTGCLWGDCDRTTADNPVGKTYTNGNPISNDIYVRMQIYFSSDFDYASKLFFWWPEEYTDKPSANIDAGLAYTFLWAASLNTNFRDGLGFRVGSNSCSYKIYPGDNHGECHPEHQEYVVGQGYGNNSSSVSTTNPPSGIPYPGTMFRWGKGRWYTVEFRYKLSSPGVQNGTIEAWVDGVKIYSDNDLETCGNYGSNEGSCVAVEEFVQQVWYNKTVWEDHLGNTTGYVLIDNLIISSNYIGPPSGTPPTTLTGDLNLDRIVNSLDWSLMNAAWSTNNATADLNRDGIVNSLDFSLMNANWGRTS